MSRRTVFELLIVYMLLLGITLRPGSAITCSQNCSTNAVCTITNGTSACVCSVGYEGDGIVCADINECLTGTNNCSSTGSMCINTLGSYDCHCTAGFEGDGILCTDVDECVFAAQCSANAACKNALGSYSCECNAGWTGDGFKCADINECSQKIDSCSPNATCFNQIGTYFCACKEGYFGNGYFCYDINECANSAVNNCSRAAKCHNTAPGFYCECNPGYEGDGYSCALTNPEPEKSTSVANSDLMDITQAGIIIGCVIAATVVIIVAFVAFIKSKEGISVSRERKVTFGSSL